MHVLKMQMAVSSFMIDKWLKIVGLVTVSSASCYIILNTYLKKLHSLMKNFLKAVAIHNFSSSLITIGQTIFFLVARVQNFETCSIMSQALIPAASCSWNSLTILSFMRYHIAWKTANNEAVDKSLMVKVVASVFVFEHLMNVVWNLASYNFQMPFWTVDCARESMDGPMVFHGYIIFKVIFVMTVGVVFDILLIKFLNKRNKSLGPGQAKLVKWKSSNEQEYGFTVPISAAIVSFVSMAAMIGIMVWVVMTIGQSHIQIAKWEKTFCEFCMTLQMPAMIALTLKAAKKKKTSPKIPKAPMFHDDDEDEQEEEVSNENRELQLSTNNDSNHQPTSSRIIYVKPAPDIESHI